MPFIVHEHILRIYEELTYIYNIQDEMVKDYDEWSYFCDESKVKNGLSANIY